MQFVLSNLGTPSLRFNNTHRIKTTRNSRTSLRISAEIDYVNAEDAKKLIAEEGYSIVDVRDRIQFERAHIKSCNHVPLFIENQDNDICTLQTLPTAIKFMKSLNFFDFDKHFRFAATIINRQLHNNFSGLFYGLPFTKPNPDFVQSVKSKFSPDSKILIVCQEGLRYK